MRFYKFWNISLLKSAIFNIKYFGWASLLKLPVLVSKNVRLVSLRGSVFLDWRNMPRGCVRIGFPMVGIFDNKIEKTLFDNSGTIYFKGPAVLGGGTRISNKGKLTIGANVSITANTAIVCEYEIEIGNNSLFSWDILIMDSDFHKVFDKSHNLINGDKKIVISDHVWIGCRSTILKGTIIPQNSIIAAGSVISSEMSNENCIYRSKGELIKKDIYWSM